MQILLANKNVSVENSNSILAFERPQAAGHPDGWDRYLTVDGKPAYHIGNICGTCAFLFERLAGANQKVSAREISEQLRNGLVDISGELLSAVTRLVPRGEYVASLQVINPRKIALGSSDDYFSREQIDLFGKDPFWGLPHYPKIEYYRALTKIFEEDKALFEFVIPMYPQSWLKSEQVQQYRQSIASGSQPTALSITILDRKYPSDSDGTVKISEHWCLAHYLMDGHHKVLAASQENRPITLLSLLCLPECIASKEDVDKVLGVLAAAT